MAPKPTKPNKDAAEAIAASVISLTEEELLGKAGELEAAAAGYRAVKENLDSIPAMLLEGMAAFKSEYEPKSDYDETDPSTEKALSKAGKRLEKLAAASEKQASGLRWLAEHNNQVQSESAKDAGDVDTNLDEVVPC